MELSHKNVYQCAPFSIHVGRMKEDDVTHYLVVHDTFEVVEYETDILAAAIAWAQHFSGELEKLQKGEPSDTADVTGNVVPFSGKLN